MSPTLVPARHRARLPRVPLLTVATTGAFALGAGLLAATPLTAHADPFANGSVTVLRISTLDTNRTPQQDCNRTVPALAATASPALTPEAPVQLIDETASGAYTSTADNTDKISGEAQLTGTARLTTSGDHPSGITNDFSGRVAATTTKPRAACALNNIVQSFAAATVTLTEPMWATLSATNGGPATGAEAMVTGVGATIHRTTTEVTGGHVGTSSTDAFLPAGTYRIGALGRVDVTLRTTATVKGAGSAAVRLHQVGSASVAPRGKALRHVRLPKAVGCDAGTATVRLTNSQRRLKTIRKVTVTVAGRAPVTLSGHKLTTGRATALPVKARATGQLRVVVTTKATRRSPAQNLVGTATYRPCTG